MGPKISATAPRHALSSKHSSVSCAKPVQQGIDVVAQLSAVWPDQQRLAARCRKTVALMDSGVLPGGIACSPQCRENATLYVVRRIQAL